MGCLRKLRKEKGGTGHWLKGRDEMRARGDEADKGQCCVNNHNHIK